MRYTFIKSIVSRKKMRLAIWDEETGNTVKEEVIYIDNPEQIKQLISEYAAEEKRLNKQRI